MRGYNKRGEYLYEDKRGGEETKRKEKKKK